MMLREACLLLGLLAFSLATTDIRQQNQGGPAGVDEELKLAAQSKLTAKADKSKYLFNVTNGDDVLALLRSSGPWKMELVKVAKGGLQSYKPKVFSNMTGTTTVTGARGENGTVNLDVTYTGGAGEGLEFEVTAATVKLSIATNGISSVKRDYWNLLSASMSVTYSLNGTAVPAVTVDVTPRTGYGPNKADVSCSNGYSICAPIWLSWTCGDQTLKKVNYTDLTAGSNTFILHIPGLALRPFKTGAKSTGFGYNWDCDPLLSIPLWTSILITLGLASILFYALWMVSSIYTPSKYDDPKGPTIHVPQTD